MKSEFIAMYGGIVSGTILYYTLKRIIISLVNKKKR